MEYILLYTSCLIVQLVLYYKIIIPHDNMTWVSFRFHAWTTQLDISAVWVTSLYLFDKHDTIRATGLAYLLWCSLYYFHQGFSLATFHSICTDNSLLFLSIVGIVWWCSSLLMFTDFSNTPFLLSNILDRIPIRYLSTHSVLPVSFPLWHFWIFTSCATRATRRRHRRLLTRCISSANVLSVISNMGLRIPMVTKVHIFCSAWT